MLTTQEQNTLQFIRGYLAQYGYAPKFKEIGLAIGVNSQGTIHRYVQSLEDKGYSDRVKGNSRGMNLVELPLVSAPTIPLVGKIAAGLPIEAVEDQQELIDAVESCKDNKAVRQVGIEFAIQQSKELKAAGVPVLHYYSMGKSDNIQAIAKSLF